MTMQDSQQQNVSTFFGLPLELRHCIYDLLLNPLKDKTKHEDTYVLPHEYPVHDFSTYCMLLQICPQLHSEVTYQFKALYLPNIAIYIVENIPALYDLTQKLRSAPHHIRDLLRFVLVSRCHYAAIGRPHPSESDFADPMEQLIERHCDYLFDIDPYYDVPSKSDHTPDPNRAFWWNRVNGSRILRVLRGKTRVNVTYPPQSTLLKPTNIRILQRHLRDNGRSEYIEVSGRVCELSWEGYDADETVEAWEYFATAGKYGVEKFDVYMYGWSMGHLMEMLVEDPE